MAEIVWTKEWSSADDGTIVSGQDLANLQSDINVGVTTNAVSIQGVPVDAPEASDDDSLLFYDHSNLKFDYVTRETLRNTKRTIVWYVSALSVETDASAKIRFPIAGTIVRSQAYVKTAPTDASLIVDINKNGTTIGSSKLTIGSGAYSDSQTSFDTTVVSIGDYFTIDIDQVGSTVTGQDLTVMLDIEVE